MYGLGFEARSTRYTSMGSASDGTENRCDGTTWKASPASMSPTSFSTIALYSSTVRCAVTSGSGRVNDATDDASGAARAASIASRRATASAYASSTRSAEPSQFTALAMRVIVPSWWSIAARSVASSHTISGRCRSSTVVSGSRSRRRTAS
ncbi:Uncharacterised protein (plasmid) [Tsukamurella tyrosinosolvens]|nr:Uncharacterised protein [Tsukamurella tyrosinosolvens]